MTPQEIRLFALFLSEEVVKYNEAAIKALNDGHTTLYIVNATASAVAVSIVTAITKTFNHASNN